MALEKILYPLVIDGGIDTKTDKALIPVGKNIISENTTLEELGAINKRNGFTVLSDNIKGGGLLSTKNITGIIPHNDEIVAIGKPGEDEVYSFDGQSNEWIRKDTDILSPQVFIEEELNDSYTLNSIDSVEIPAMGYRFVACVYATQDTATGILTKLVVYKIDYINKTKRIIYTREKVTTSVKSAFYVKINAINTSASNIWVSYLEFSNVALVFDANINVLTLNKDGTVLADLVCKNLPTAMMHFDTIVDGTNLILVTQTNSTTQLHGRIVSQAGASVNSATITVTGPVDQTALSGIALEIYNSLLYIVYIDNTNNKVRALAVNKTTFAGSIADTVIDTGLTVDIGKVAIKKEGDAAGDKLLIARSTNSNVQTAPADPSISTNITVAYAHSNIRVFRVNPADLASINSTSGTYDGVLASKIFSVSGVSGFFFLSQQLTTEAMKYNLNKITLDYPLSASNFDLLHVSSFSIGTAANDIPASTGYDNKTYELSLPMISADVTEIYIPLAIAVRSITSFISAAVGHIPVMIKSGRIYRIEFDSVYKNIFSRISQNTTITGALLKEYDGQRLLNAGFIDYPTISNLTENAVGTMAAGKYAYKTIFEFTDANGQLWRSPESNPRYVTIAAAKSVDITFYSPQSLPKDLKNYRIGTNISYAGARLIIYRTEVNSTIYKRIGSLIINGAFINPWNDAAVDSEIDGNETIYTTGGVISNDLVPPLKYLLTGKNRQFGIASEDENLIYFTQPYFQGESANWSQLLTKRIDSGTLSNTGIGVALAIMDDKVIILKSSSILAFVGDGPNPLGEDDNFTDVSLLSPNIGCSDPKSVIMTPAGLIFKSPNGIYMLDRSLNPQYIGADVEDYNSETIIGAVNISKKNQVALITANRTLIYDYFQSKWIVWTFTGQDCCLWKDQFTILKDGLVYHQDETSYKDGATFQSMRLVSPWVKLSGVQEYQRIYGIIIYGEFKSAHTLTIKIYFDYDETNFETHTVSPINTDKVYQYEIHTTNQKCQSFKIEIYDNVSAGTGQGFKLSNITLKLGKKVGFNKISATRKY